MFPVIIFYVGFGVKFLSYIMVFIFFLTSKQPLFFSFIIERKGLQKLILQEFFYSVVQPSLKDYAKYITSLLLCVFFFPVSFPFLFLLYKMVSNFIIEPSADAAELDLTNVFKVTA